MAAAQGRCIIPAELRDGRIARREEEITARCWFLVGRFVFATKSPPLFLSSLSTAQCTLRKFSDRHTETVFNSSQCFTRAEKSLLCFLFFFCFFMCVNLLGHLKGEEKKKKKATSPVKLKRLCPHRSDFKVNDEFQRGGKKKKIKYEGRCDG